MSRFPIHCPGPLLLLLFCAVAVPTAVRAVGQETYITATPGPGSFPLAGGRKAAVLLTDAADWPGVLRAAHDLQTDLGHVTGLTPGLLQDDHGEGLAKNDPRFIAPNLVIIGTLGRSPIVDRLVREKKIDVSTIAGKWESFSLQVVTAPLPGVARALVITGSDKRGTIYGIYDLAEQIGVSPWQWWADVPVRHADALYVNAGRFSQGEPSVRYRGIFLNDEAPDLTNWVRATYGDVLGRPGVANYGHEFYARVFELILRLKGNYLWPAMWNNAFNEDDPANPRLADEYGIVMGTSHQEPMLRAQKEWDRGPGRQNGNWNFNNAAQQPVLEQFWREGIRRNKDYESLITLGLRAENDSGQPIGAALTEQIVSVQRKILAEELNPDLTKVPQLWCLYKEVQGFYEQGLRVPDDVTLLWAEDNWGNVRRLPTADERRRAGGAGIYYHFDYHGGPRNYQWINTSPLPKIWDQLSLAQQYGADRVWIVNVGHLRGQEIPTEFFMSLAWNTARWTGGNLGEFTQGWAAREFGPASAAAIAELVTETTRLNARRKPELLAPTTYSLTDYGEAERVHEEFSSLARRAAELNARLPENARDAFYQLVLFPLKAGAQLNEMYLAAGRNALYARQGRASTNDFAAQTRTLFQADRDLMHDYNTVYAGGRWNHFMDQKHIGYTQWNEPVQETAPRVVTLTPPADAGLGVAVEGSEFDWPGATVAAALPVYDGFSQRSHAIDVFNRGQAAFTFTATADAPWIKLSAAGGKVETDQRIAVSVDWSRAPADTATGTVKITGAGGEVAVQVSAFNPAATARAAVHGFVESEGVVAIEAGHFSHATGVGAARWEPVDGYGRTLSAMRAFAPADLPAAVPGRDSACLEYQTQVFHPGPATVILTVAPTLNFMPGRALRVAVSLDDGAPQTLTIVPAGFSAQNGNREWEESVRNNARLVRATLPVPTAGAHTLKVWMVDPAVVLERVVLDLGGLKPSYLGPPESVRRP